MDDLPQRMFASKADAQRYARELVAEEMANPFGDFHGDRVIEGPPIAIIEFEEGVTRAVEFIEREDLPESLPRATYLGEPGCVGGLAAAMEE
jgi:hypothetical protein